MIKIKPDLIVTWPKNCDYPLWRSYVKRNRQRFKEVFVVFMEPNQGHDYSGFIMQEMLTDNVTFLHSPELRSQQDWRNVAVNFALSKSKAGWVWFTEQDFYPRGFFWLEMEKLRRKFDIVAAFEADRMHPCSVLVKRELINKTKMDFGISKDFSDHFGTFQRDVDKLGITVGKIGKRYYQHYNGMSHNFSLVDRGEKPNYKPEIFCAYLRDCLGITDVKLDPYFKNILLDFLMRKNV